MDICEFTERFGTLSDSFSGNVGFVLSDPSGTPLFSVRQDSVFSSASVIKIYILGALFEAVLEGRKSLEDTIVVHNSEKVAGTGLLKELTSPVFLSVYDLAVLMIIVSDNVATNLLIDYLEGCGTVNRFIVRCGLEKTVLNRKTSPVPQASALGTTTPAETAGFLKKILRREILDEVCCEMFIDILRKQQLKSGFLRNLPLDLEYPENSGMPFRFDSASKTGSIAGVRNDVGFLFFGDAGYLFSAFTDQCEDTRFVCGNEAEILLGKLGELSYELIVGRERYKYGI